MEWFHITAKPGKVSDGIERVLVYTPDNPDIEYRIMPTFMLDKPCAEYTHWAYLTPPKLNKE